MPALFRPDGKEYLCFFKDLFTGTQGYDSLSDDAYTGTSDKPDEHPEDHESHTGSSSEDFDDKND